MTLRCRLGGDRGPAGHDVGQLESLDGRSQCAATSVVGVLLAVHRHETYASRSRAEVLGECVSHRLDGRRHAATPAVGVHVAVSRRRERYREDSTGVVLVLMLMLWLCSLAAVAAQETDRQTRGVTAYILRYDEYSHRRGIIIIAS